MVSDIYNIWLSAHTWTSQTQLKYCIKRHRDKNLNVKIKSSYYKIEMLDLPKNIKIWKNETIKKNSIARAIFTVEMSSAKRVDNSMDKLCKKGRWRHLCNRRYGENQKTRKADSVHNTMEAPRSVNKNMKSVKAEE